MILFQGFTVALRIFDFLLRSLGIPNILGKIANLVDTQSFIDALIAWRSWLSWLFYFIPKSFIVPFLECVLVFWIIRLVMALFKTILDLVHGIF